VNEDTSSDVVSTGIAMVVLERGRRTTRWVANHTARHPEPIRDTDPEQGALMRYLLLLAHDPDAWSLDTDTAPTPDDGVITDWALYTRALADAGVLVAGQALAGNDTATSVRVRDGQRLLVDGPFAETKEHLIGYYVIDVDDLDAALAWAAKVPCVRTGTVEVRPLQVGTDVSDMLGASTGTATS
jgi:hypothetical protein